MSKQEGCPKSAIGKTDFCKAHGGGVRCPNCVDWPVSRCGNKHYDGYCAYCFKRCFPGDPRSTYIPVHAKELRVRAEIEKHFDGFVHDKPLFTKECDCSIRRRIDHRKIINGTLLGIETDEYAHVHYSPEDEENRYHDIAMGHGGPMIFVRINPDMKGVSFERKLQVLIAEIKNQIAFITRDEPRPRDAGLLTEIKLFYEPSRHRIVRAF